MFKLLLPLSLLTATAQQPQAPQAPKLVTLFVQDLNVHTALSRLAAQAGLNVIVAPQVSGQVTLNMRDVPARDAIHQVAAMVSAEAWEQASVFTVRAVTAPAVQPVKLRINLVQMPIAMVAETIHKISGRKIYIDPQVKGTVTVQFTGVDFEAAMRALAASVDATVRFEPGATCIEPLTPKPAPR